MDDPWQFGRIAAANALSDLYAMGARPITALCLVCYPLKSLGLESLKAMMEGGLDALIEAGCALLGGHSVEDAEPKLGYAVTGLVDPKRACAQQHASARGGLDPHQTSRHRTREHGDASRVPRVRGP